MSKRVLLPITNGFEEIEAITIVDILRRAGASVIIAALEKRQIVGAHGVALKADAVLGDVLNENFDLVALAGGGENAQSLSTNADALAVIKRHFEAGRVVAAICAAPIALAKAGVLKGEYTCFGGCEKTIESGKYISAAVVEDGAVITSQGAGTAAAFAFALVARLFDYALAQKLKSTMYF
ncbi:4-methyl-5(B-hydroxyethyl)-thiazole monophosphate biosynthesis protein [Campylobacterota bacterium]|nr:4-methyl-5(B-hydroxyethyl)-thiazole monophosphate biosynthesis protein [Campylobacterota bacterium]